MTSSTLSATVTPLLVVSPLSLADTNNHPFTIAITTDFHLLHDFNHNISFQYYTQQNLSNHHSSTKTLNRELSWSTTTTNHKCRSVLQRSLHNSNHTTIFLKLRASKSKCKSNAQSTPQFCNEPTNLQVLQIAKTNHYKNKEWTNKP